MHVHAFSPLEVTQGAATLGLPIARLPRQPEGRPASARCPGTAAEILDDEVRADHLPGQDQHRRNGSTCMRAAHELGLRTTSTIMYGHVETPRALGAASAARCATCRRETGGFTEFVPLPFVHMEAPMYRQGTARRGPTFREAVLMHAVARLALHPLIPNIQTSWVKMGPDGRRDLPAVRAPTTSAARWPAGAAICLESGANDLGGTLMNESISRAAGTQHGQELPPEAMEALIRSIGREPQQRDTLYRAVPEERRAASLVAADLAPIILTPPRKRVAAA